MDNSTTIQIPSFDGMELLEIKVKRPQLMAMMNQGKIPNHLMGVAVNATLNKHPNKDKQTDEEHAKELAKWVEFYCTICMVEPLYEEVKGVITDDQAMAIYAWAILPVSYLRSFRDNKEDATNNPDGEALQPKA